jgi:hypothetical protein
MWKVIVQNMISNVKYETRVKTDRDLGTFLLGFDKKENKIVELKKIPNYTIKESKEFLKKNKNLELGK